jgi:hypothetical protein
MTVLATAIINTSALWKIIVASFVGGAGVVILFGLLLIGVSRAEAARSAGNAGSRVVYLAGSAICGVICVALVVVGIYAMAKKPSTATAKPAAKAAFVAPPRAA